ncbi:hypothetical protein PG987_010974 [Apiospora arundinis]
MASMTETFWESLERLAGDTEAIEGKKESLTFLTHVIVARKAQGDWFFPGHKCPGHLEHEQNLADKRVSVIRTLYLMDFAIFTKTPDNLLQDSLENILTTVPITQSLDMLTGESLETPEEFLLVKQEATELLWDKLQRLEIVQLLDRRTATIPQLLDQRYTYQPQISIPQRENVDWNEVLATFGASDWLVQQSDDHHEQEDQNRRPSAGWLARGTRRLLCFS